MKEPTYSQIEAAATAFAQEFTGNSDAEADDVIGARHCMKLALIAAQKVDPNIYGHLHHGMSVDGVTLVADSKESIDKVMTWHHVYEAAPGLREAFDARLAYQKAQLQENESVMQGMDKVLQIEVKVRQEAQELMLQTAHRLIDQSDEPNFFVNGGNFALRMNYWRDKAIMMAQKLSLAHSKDKKSD